MGDRYQQKCRTTMTRILDSNAIAYDMEQKEYPVVAGYLELEMSPLEALSCAGDVNFHRRRTKKLLRKREMHPQFSIIKKLKISCKSVRKDLQFKKDCVIILSCQSV